MLYKMRYYIELPEEMFRITLNYEGGYQNYSWDSGNYLNGKLLGTKYGITPGAISSAMSIGLLEKETIDVDYIKNLPVESARLIYNRKYYIPNNIHKIPTPLNILVFDTSILHGLGGSAKILQNTLFGNGYKDIKIDGDLGSKTIEILQKSLLKDGIDDLCNDFISLRLARTIEIAKNDSKKQKALTGWKNRIYAISKVVKSILEQKVVY